MTPVMAVSALIIVVAAIVCGLVWSRRRRRNDPVFRRANALAALGRITQAPRPAIPPCHHLEPIEHVSLIGNGANARSRVRRGRRARTRRHNHRPDTNLARPTIAVLPKLITDAPARKNTN
jgi:hypothetical protein